MKGIMGNLVLAIVGLFYILWGIFNWRIFNQQKQKNKSARILKSVSGLFLCVPAFFQDKSNSWWHLTLWVWALLFIISNAIEELSRRHI